MVQVAAVDNHWIRSSYGRILRVRADSGIEVRVQRLSSLRVDIACVGILRTQERNTVPTLYFLQVLHLLRTMLAGDLHHTIPPLHRRRVSSTLTASVRPST